MARVLDVTRDTIYKYESNSFYPAYDIFLILLQKFNLNINWLLTGEGPKYRSKNDKGGEAPTVILPEEKELLDFIKMNPKFKTLFRKYMAAEKLKTDLEKEKI